MIKNNSQLLTETVIDVYFLFRVIKRLCTPFNKWDAYKLGIIDDRGNVLKPKKTLITKEEKDAWTIFDIFVKNIKRILEKIPGGKTPLASYITGLYLIRESKYPQDDDEDLVYEAFYDFFEAVFSDHHLKEQAKDSFKRYLQLIGKDDTVLEDAPANSVAGGGVAGLTEPIVVNRKRRNIERREETTT